MTNQANQNPNPSVGAPVRRSVEHILADVAAYFGWTDDPKFEACPRCQGKGYHHGFGEGGVDPDWCTQCGGPGEVPTAAGELCPDDLLEELAAAVTVAREAQAEAWQPPTCHGPMRLVHALHRCETCGSVDELSDPPPIAGRDPERG